MEVKEMLKEIMKQKDIDQQQLADLLDVNKAQITRWLDGAAPKPINLHKIYHLYQETIKAKEEVKQDA